jgi:glycosyltransferase involved in cell wall biosynthesis
MHIVYVIAPGGGPETYVKTLLPWLERQGHRVSIVYTVRSTGGAHAFPPHVRVLYAPRGSLHYYLSKLVSGFRAWPLRLRAWERAWAVYWALCRIDEQEPVDVVEVTEGLPLALLRRRWAVVVRAQGSAWTVRHFCRDGDSRWDAWLIRQEAQQLRDAYVVSALSEHLADHLSAFCQFPRGRIRAIPYPIDTERFRPDDAHRFTSPHPTLMSIGRLERRKGIDVLLRALPAVWEEFPDSRLALLGSEAEFTQGQLLQMVPASKRQHVVFPGFVAHEKLPAYYRAADVYVAPTQYEAFGYTILEAMACGCPVISCRVGGVPELIEENGNGVLLSFGEEQALSQAITDLLSSPDRCNQMGRMGRRLSLRYALDRVGPLHEEMYQQAIDSKMQCKDY